jgi:light-regulated signal transduction histidine kinase (bacteriophytochrome)
MLNLLEDFDVERAKAETANRELRDAFESLRRAKEAADSANRELEAFSYSVSHDLRAPLQSIDGFSLALLEDYQNLLDDRGNDYLRRVRNATRRMADLIDDLLKLSRLTRGELNLATVDLSALARTVAAELQKSQPRRQVSFGCAEGLTATGDPNLLKVVLDNLLGNAWKFTGKKEAATIEFGFAEIEGRAAYFVKDNGSGFDMSYADKLFVTFQRLHLEREFPGTGIGLSLVQRIIRRHGGEVWAKGQVGRGATFYFTLNPPSPRTEP